MEPIIFESRLLNYALEPFFRESRDQALICNSKLWDLGLTLKFKSAHIKYRDYAFKNEDIPPKSSNRR